DRQWRPDRRRCENSRQYRDRFLLARRCRVGGAEAGPGEEDRRRRSGPGRRRFRLLGAGPSHGSVAGLGRIIAPSSWRLSPAKLQAAGVEIRALPLLPPLSRGTSPQHELLTEKTS